ncbi:hypothetical protein [Bradyrhizobium neotropicale]|jgi:hypothetical protein|uniref:hypothetical protein n=1 Tax=Bradyrhizobium neotropicale TaxID=1497615 RepID=UPI001AD61C94|nr:hypothetical protein [Bradyrhizobium neotropicale]MBO4226853.1 hypothetical protein [Bradyrhizobium neotropicale]
MKDLTGKWHQLRADAKHCADLGMSATDPRQRELFKHLGDELAIAALELEQVVKSQKPHSDLDEQCDVLSKAIAGK